MKKKVKEEIVEEVSDIKITSKDVMSFIGSLVGVFVFAKKLYDYYNQNK